MDAIGAQEVHFPALLPREPYEATGRWTEYGDNIFRLKDRKGADYLLGPTHEEMFTLLVKDLYSSYKDLPLSIYQIQNKYRDEARPRAGLLRGREFVDEGLLLLRRRRRRPRRAPTSRTATPTTGSSTGSASTTSSCRRDAGAMGGSRSEEFLHPTPIGEDTFVRCTTGDYAANVEACHDASSPRAAAVRRRARRRTSSDTPDTPTIETLVDARQRDAPARRTGRGPPRHAQERRARAHAPRRHAASRSSIGLPGDREVDLKRLEAPFAPAEVEAATEADFARPARRWSRATSAVAARCGLGEKATLGHPLPGRPARRRRHPLGHRRQRARQARARPRRRPRLHRRRHDRGGRGARRRPCPDGSRPARARPRHRDRATSSSSAASTPRRSASRCSTRTASSSRSRWAPTASASPAPSPPSPRATTTSKGLIWPREVAPADVHVVADRQGRRGRLRGRREARRASSRRPASTCCYDDRPKVSPGVKFKDAELIGVPTIVVVGKGLADGIVEVRDRRTGQRDKRRPAEVLGASPARGPTSARPPTRRPARQPPHPAPPSLGLNPVSRKICTSGTGRQASGPVGDRNSLRWG